MNVHFNIGTVARLSGYRIAMIRYFEKMGVISPTTRTAGRYRVFGPHHVKELAFVSRMQDLGFYTPQIRELRQVMFGELPGVQKREALRKVFEEHVRYVRKKADYFTMLVRKLEEAETSFIEDLLQDSDEKRVP